MSTRRAFEHLVRKPRLKRDKDLRRLQTVRYERLMQVSIRHTFYNDSNNKCPDFEIRPTPSSVALMKSLGLLFKTERAGFSILFNRASEESLTNYLREQARRDRGPVTAGPVWTRLSFALSLTNPYFVNFTDIAINTNPIEENFYFTNQFAHLNADGAIVINPDDPDEFALDRIRVVPTQVPVSLGKDIKEVHVFDISGEVVICRPRCVPKSLLKQKRAAEITCDEAASCTKDDEECKCTDTVYLDFSLLREDKYTIELIHYGVTPPEEVEVLYTASYPVPLCFIDLLFTKPTSTEPGIYPVENLFPKEATTIDPVHYEIWFNRRATFWSYYVVPPQGESYEDLFISSEPLVEFAGPCCVKLPDGETTAYRFLSKVPIALLEKSTIELQLQNQVTPIQADVIVKRLPVASSQQVLPMKLTAVCRDLKDSLCPFTEPDNRCEELIEFVCDPENPPNLLEKNYSDIYVYV